MSQHLQSSTPGHLTCYVDGSTIKPAGTRSYFQGWAVVALGANLHDAPCELVSAAHVPKALDGLHEYTAFVKALELALLLNKPWSQVILYTDDSFIEAAPFHLHPANRSPKADIVLNRFRTVLPLIAASFGCQITFEQVLEGLTHARIVGIRSHQGYVYQERADYLARQAAIAALATEVSAGSQRPNAIKVWLDKVNSLSDLRQAPLSFQDWLFRGLMRFHPASQTYIVQKFPFTSQEELACPLNP